MALLLLLLLLLLRPAPIAYYDPLLSLFSVRCSLWRCRDAASRFRVQPRRARRRAVLGRLPRGDGSHPARALARAALGLLRYGFAIASPRNDAIPDDSRDGHLPCEE